jgi:hypothetical protein
MNKIKIKYQVSQPNQQQSTVTTEWDVLLHDKFILS